MNASSARGSWVCVSRGLRLVSTLPALADHRIVHHPLRLPADARGVIGWGLKAAGTRAAAYAARVGLPYIALEDGFLRSVGLGDTDPPLSMAIDPVGVYYDARRPSRLEQQIAAPHDEAQRARGRRIAEAWRAGRVSKYNHARETPLPLSGPFVLAVDQTFGDMSIELGLASASSFVRMVEAALDEHPRLPVVLKVHPDVVAGRKRAHIPALSAGAASRVMLLADNAHPPALLEAAHAVYVVTSQMGFEALIWGKPVRCFGMPFYAGWGLTQDDLKAPERRRGHAVQLDDLVHAALVEYPNCIDPETHARCDIERLIDWMALQRQHRDRVPARVQALSFPAWQRPLARHFLAGSQLRFVDRPQSLSEGEVLAVWGSTAGVVPAGALRVTTGPMHALGLGPKGARPMSWCMASGDVPGDDSAAGECLQRLVARGVDSGLQARAQALRLAILASGPAQAHGGWRRPAGRPLVALVIGQAPSAASAGVDFALLSSVRVARPGAWIVYRPADKAHSRTRRVSDETVAGVALELLLPQVDEVHVHDAMAGFLALLFGRPVVCHGRPFYAGWGLTEDLPRAPRTRTLTLDELVAVALIEQPVYLSRSSSAFTTPEQALRELTQGDAGAPPRDVLVLRALRSLKRLRDRLRRRP